MLPPAPPAIMAVSDFLRAWLLPNRLPESARSPFGRADPTPQMAVLTGQLMQQTAKGQHMDTAWEERVRIRAYEIWEREGRPEGGAEQRWLRAEEELLAEETGINLDVERTPEAMPDQGGEEESPRKPTGTGTVATGTVVDPDLAGTSR